jgi:hypothetical protein
MRTKVNQRLISMFVFMGLGAGSAMAARNFSGVMAMPDNNAQATCFDHGIDGSHLGLTRNSGCDGTPAVWLPITVDNGGWPVLYPVTLTVTVEGYTPAVDQEVVCGAYSVNNAGTITGAVWGGIPFAEDNVALGPIRINNPSESAVVLCFLPKNGIIFNYHY